MQWYQKRSKDNNERYIPIARGGKCSADAADIPAYQKAIWCLMEREGVVISRREEPGVLGCAVKRIRTGSPRDRRVWGGGTVVALASLHIRTMNEIYGVGYPVIHDLHRLCFHRVVLSVSILPNPITLCRYHGAQAFLKTPNQFKYIRQRMPGGTKRLHVML